MPTKTIRRTDAKTKKMVAELIGEAQNLLAVNRLQRDLTNNRTKHTIKEATVSLILLTAINDYSKRVPKVNS